MQQLVLSFDTRFFRHLACSSLLPARPGYISCQAKRLGMLVSAWPNQRIVRITIHCCGQKIRSRLARTIVMLYIMINAPKKCKRFPVSRRELFPARDSLVNDIPPGDGKTLTFFKGLTIIIALFSGVGRDNCLGEGGCDQNLGKVLFTVKNRHCTQFLV
jgi:hypothetical protein